MDMFSRYTVQDSLVQCIRRTKCIDFLYRTYHSVKQLTGSPHRSQLDQEMYSVAAAEKTIQLQLVQQTINVDRSRFLNSSLRQCSPIFTGKINQNENMQHS